MTRPAATASTKPRRASVPCIVSIRIMSSMLFFSVRAAPRKRQPTLADVGAQHSVCVIFW
jgi:hypothetical protein